MAVYNNRRLAAQFFDRPVGIVAPGAYADLILLDYYPTTPLTADNAAVAHSLRRQRRARTQHNRPWSRVDAQPRTDYDGRGRNRGAQPYRCGGYMGAVLGDVLVEACANRTSVVCAYRQP